MWTTAHLLRALWARLLAATDNLEMYTRNGDGETGDGLTVEGKRPVVHEASADAHIYYVYGGG